MRHEGEGRQGGQGFRAFAMGYPPLDLVHKTFRQGRHPPVPALLHPVDEGRSEHAGSKIPEPSTFAVCEFKVDIPSSWGRVRTKRAHG